MKQMKRGLALALAAGLVMALAACGGGVSRGDATVYVQGRLDAQYKGEYSEKYIEMVEDMTQADAEEMNQKNLEIEADYLLSFIDAYEPDEAATAKAQSLLKQIYAQSKYTVGEADKLQSGDFAVEVIVSPVELISLLENEAYSTTWDDTLTEAGIATQEELDAFSEEEYVQLDNKYVMKVLQQLEDLMPQLTYGDDQVIMLQLKLDEDGYYSLVDSGVQKLDETVIDYYGEFIQ